jgi:transcriptional regulatory protein LevR
MSEKQSTDELVRALEIQLKMETDCVITNLEIRAIIARLRAADNLKNKSLMKLAADLEVSFSAAKILEDHVRAEYDAKLRTADKLYRIATKARFIISVYCKEHIKEYDKAIAEYEEKV